MANYTTTEFKTRGTIGDSMFFGNMATSGSITITPIRGYVVTASDFSIGNESNLTRKFLDDGTSNSDYIASNIILTDTSTAGQPGNTVKVTVNFASDYVISKIQKVKLNIVGDAKIWRPETSINASTAVVLVDDKNNTSYGTSSITTENNYTIDTVTSVGVRGVFDIITNTITGSALKSTSTKIGSLTITADDNYYFVNKPYLRFIDNSKSIKLRQTSITRDNNDYITKYNFDLMFNSNVNLNVNDESNVFIEYSAKAIPIAKNEITNITFGDTQIPSTGVIRPIKIYGDIGAEFDMTITKEYDGSSILDSLSNASFSNNSARTVSASTFRKSNIDVFTPSGTIRGIYKKIQSRRKKKSKGISYCVLNQEFPPNIGYKTTINGSKTSTTMTIAGNTENIRVGDQLVYSDLTTGTIVTVSSITDANNVVLSSSVAQDNSDTVKFVRTEKYNIDIYPRAGTTLSSKIPSSYPHFTLNQYRDVRLTLTATAGTNYTLTTYALSSYVGKANSVTNRVLRPSETRSFSISIVATVDNTGTQTFTTRNNPTWSSTSSTTSNWTNSVHADTLDGSSRGNLAVVTTNGNGGTHIEIYNLKTTTNGGRTIATITGDVRIKKWGNKDVTMNLDTSAFLTSGS